MEQSSAPAGGDKTPAQQPGSAAERGNVGTGLFSRGLAALRAKRADEAVDLLRQAISVRRAQPLYHFKLGQALQAAGRLDEAAEALANSIRLKPDMWLAHIALGVVHQKRGELAQAARYSKQGRRLALAGLVQRAVLAPRLLGVRALAMAKYSHRGKNAMVAQARCRVGRIHEGRGKLDAAKTAYRRALSADPDCIDALNAFGQLLSDGRVNTAAANHLEKARTLDPDNPETLAILAPVLARLGRYDEAVSTAEACLALKPAWPRSHLAMGWALSLKGDSAGAVPHFESALAIDSRLADGHLGLGIALQSLGKLDEAVAQFRLCLSIEPDNGEALFFLSKNIKLGDGDAESTLIEQALARIDLPAAQRMNLNFAAGKMYDDFDDADKAFEHYQLANDLMDAEFDPEDNAAQVTATIETFDADFFEKTKGYGETSELPVFIVGMPRSGTTLVEQIIASHPDIFGAGELAHIRDATERLPASLGVAEAYPGCMPKIDRDTVRSLAGAYLERLRSLSPEALRVTDKMPGNFSHLGFIALLFPHARVIHCMRDPMDVCVSNYFTRFTGGLSYSFDLTNLGLFYRQYERLMDHWRRVLPIQMLDLRYEDLIADQAGVSRKIIDACGLAWDDRCLAFHKTERVVLTASYSQVRQPIYSNSIGRWRRYEEQLAPLLDALGSQAG